MISKRSIGKTGLSLSTLGFGGAPLGGLFTAIDETAASEALAAGLTAGITYVDTAPFYGFGRSERLVGDQLRGSEGHILSTKVGRLLRPGRPPDPASMGWPDPLPFHPVFDYTYDGVMRSLEDSYQRLGLDRIDILYVHDIGAFTHGPEGEHHVADLERSGYRALEALRAGGVIKAIGLGVNEVAICRRALTMGDWDVFLLAGRYTLLEQDPLDDLLPECEVSNTKIVIGGPFNSGILVGGDTWNYGPAPADVVDRVGRMRALAAKHDVALPVAALQFPLAHPAVVSVIPGMRDRKELDGVLAWARIEIPDAFWRDMKAGGLIREEAPIPTTNPFFEDRP